MHTYILSIVTSFCVQRENGIVLLKRRRGLLARRIAEEGFFNFNSHSEWCTNSPPQLQLGTAEDEIGIANV